MADQTITLDDLLSDEQITRIVSEVAEAAGDRGVSHEDLYAAADAMKSVMLGHALAELWIEGRARIGWDANRQELKYFNRAAT